MGKKKYLELFKHYELFKDEILNRLKDFDYIWENGTEKNLFAELCFCLCTPQSSAKLADKAILRLKKNDVLFYGSHSQIRECMVGVRFPNNKSEYIFQARRIFKDGKSFFVRKFIDLSNPERTRDWLVENVKGMGYKEASHFLRNIGLGRELAILDKHILKNMKELGIIESIPKTLTKRIYLDFEDKVRVFSSETGISMAELDLVFWSNETGEVFK